MPEQRHLLLEWPLCVHEAKQPTLLGVEDPEVRLEGTARCCPDVPARTDVVIHIVDNRFVIDEPSYGTRKAELSPGIGISGGETEAGSPKQMCDGRVTM